MDNHASLLIVEDDLDLAEMLGSYFRLQGLDVRIANWGEDALAACAERLPNLVLLDIRLPDIDGFEVAARLRNNRRTRHLPILFLTEKRERKDRLRGLALDANDYITKPFDLQELRLRVLNTLARTRRSTLSNPVTGLPEGAQVEDQLAGFLKEGRGGLLRVSVINLDGFREKYGFVASDDLLRAVALMLTDALQELGTPADFLGQLDSGRFLVITRVDHLAALKERIAHRLAQSFDYFYRNQDLDQGGISARLGIDVQDWPAANNTGKTLLQLKHELG